MNVFSLLNHNGQKHPQKEALAFGDRRQTWSQLALRVELLAGSIRKSGIVKGDNVALLLENSDYFIEIHFALAYLGAVTVPLNYRLSSKELEFVLSNSESKMIFYGSAYSETVHSIKANLPVLNHFIEVGAEGGPYNEFIAKGERTKPAQVRGDDSHVILYTSGTTGRPKGAVLTHDNSIWNALNMVIEAGIEHNNRGIVVPPLYHSASLNCWMLPHVMVGASMVVEQSFNPKELSQRLVQEKITNIFLVPAMYNFLLQVADVQSNDFSALSLAGTGASIMPIDLKKKVKSLFPNAGIIDVYGLSEAGPGVMILKAIDAFRKEGSVGKPMTTLQVRLVNDKGNDVRQGEVGEIIVQGPTIMKEYYGLPEATEAALQDGWLFSGDLAKQDEEGYFYIIDRKKDMLICGGENIYPAEVEAVLCQHPNILEVAVIGVPDHQWGESVCAIVVLRPGTKVTPEEVIEFARGKLASYKKPRYVVFSESLPRNPSGKVLKRVLRREYETISINS